MHETDNENYNSCVHSVVLIVTLLNGAVVYNPQQYLGLSTFRYKKRWNAPQRGADLVRRYRDWTVKKTRVMQLRPVSTVLVVMVVDAGFSDGSYHLLIRFIQQLAIGVLLMFASFPISRWWSASNPMSIHVVRLQPVLALLLSVCRRLHKMPYDFRHAIFPGASLQSIPEQDRYFQIHNTNELYATKPELGVYMRLRVEHIVLQT